MVTAAVTSGYGMWTTIRSRRSEPQTTEDETQKTEEDRNAWFFILTRVHRYPYTLPLQRVDTWIIPYDVNGWLSYFFI